MIESSWDCIKLLDAEGHLVSMNAHGQRMLEIDDLQLFLGRPWTELWRGPDHESAVAAFEAARTGGVGRFCGQCSTVRGAPRYWDVLVTPVLNTAGQPERLLVISRDITVSKEAEQSAASQADELERKTRELARSNAELEQFASIVSHDLRSPLLSINGCVELLAEQAHGRLAAEDRELLGMVRTSVRVMSDLIKGLLDYARVDAGGLKVAPCDAGRVLERVISGMGKLFQETHTTFTHDPLPVIHADERLLIHLFQNLLENAVKYHSSEPPRIHVGARQSGREWVFFVQDNGIGVDPQHSTRIFQMFKRVHREEGTTGSGVGLAVCKKIVERHGGRIWVASEPGQGSTFHFSLPGD